MDTSWLDLEVFEMANKTVRYTPEFKRQMVDLVRSGQNSRHRCRRSSDRRRGRLRCGSSRQSAIPAKATADLTTAEREELSRLRRENRKLKEEREILSKAAAWFATESGTSKRSSDS